MLAFVTWARWLQILWLMVAAALCACGTCPDSQVKRDGQCKTPCNSINDCPGVEHCTDGVCEPFTPIQSTSSSSTQPPSSAATSALLTSSSSAPSSRSFTSSSVGASTSAVSSSSRATSTVTSSVPSSSSAPSSASLASSSTSTRTSSSSLQGTSSSAACALHWLDADGDGYTTTDNMMICGTPGQGWILQRNGVDCDDGNPAVYQMLNGYHDVDGDGFTREFLESVCTAASLPSHWFSAVRGPDCDDTNGAKWQTVERFYDADGDGVGVGTAQTACVGSVLPPGAPRGGDCDDTDPLTFPGQTQFFTAPRASGSFDYDCDGATQFQRTVFACMDCSATPVLVACGASYVGCPDLCGNTAFFECDTYCDGSIQPYVMACH